ncbi:Casein kinase II subunit beta [Zancudomyces culisetae]|uniref:Casein kinase II subunit beta n=1 Tax=Zancudomyces culisetae TaxID=1213189 RepID=A0A1R1PTJ3_ZANCU|nr:Casein kinase II subunit beta [Zancudomyces culisetae]OMH84345.1 Casein kinase II subunit beta [Zancudomyces culisetae]|eukprot:OMH84264.1 Casein kinase II subunit beta [Zancudomyces culisetae]
MSETDSEGYKYWVEWFLNTKGNEFFCEIDDEYILDRFNLTGLHAEVAHYQQAFDLITDQLDEDSFDDEQSKILDRSAKHLYGLIHARFIITTRGLIKMVEKYKRGDFGRCPRVYCNQQNLLPVGITDVPNEVSVKLYCCRCEDIYHPKSSRHCSIDGAYFGTSFPHMLLQAYPSLKPPPLTEAQRYVPKIFGFKIHNIANVHRWQDAQRKAQASRLAAYEAENKKN